MLFIRSAQLQAMQAAERATFEARALAHVTEVFPDTVEAMGERAARERVRAGVDRAATYDVTAREDVLLFLDLDFELGAPFEASPEMAWARAVLDRRATPARVRMRLIYDRLLDEPDEEEEI